MKELNQLRKQALLWNIFSFGLIAIGFISFMGYPTLGMPMFIGGGISLVIVNATVGKTFNQTYKEMICKGVLEQMFDIKAYTPEQGFSKDFVRNTYLIPIGNRYHSDDYIAGSYHGVDFERSDVHMQNHQKTGKTSTTVTYFKGSWTVFTFPKKVSSYIMIREKEFLSNGKPGGFFSDAPTTTKVTFEDIDFNDRFEVYAQDEHDAFYVCTPQFIERIKRLEASHEGRLTIGIMDQKVHVLFYDNSNAMEPSLFNEVTEEDLISVKQEMNQIIEVMDALNLIGKE